MADVELRLAVADEDEEAHPASVRIRMNVLFLCIGNAGRSQMAHAFLERTGGHQVRSAGSRAEQRLHPEVVEAMEEIGYDLSGRTPRQLEPEADAAWADVVVTMGCGDVCPVLPGKSYVDWNLEDPAGKSIERVRELRDEIERRVADLVRELDSTRATSA
jgi:arsenate reductase